MCAGTGKGNAQCGQTTGDAGGAEDGGAILEGDGAGRAAAGDRGFETDGLTDGGRIRRDAEDGSRRTRYRRLLLGDTLTPQIDVFNKRVGLTWRVFG